MLFLFNDRIADVMCLLNGGQDYLQATGNQITFVSSLLEIMPMVELVILTILLWRIGKTRQQIELIEKAAMPMIPDNPES
jgi:hypothetical protein